MESSGPFRQAVASARSLPAACALALAAGLGCSKKHVPDRVRESRDAGPAERTSPADVSAKARPPEEKPVPDRTGKSKDRDPAVSRSAADAPRKIAPAPKKVVPGYVIKILKRLKDPNPRVRKTAAEALGKFGPAAEGAVPALIQALKDTDGSVRGRAAFALGKIGPAAKEAVPALMEALKDTNPDVRVSAARALGKIGPATKEVVPALIQAMKHDKEMAFWSAVALGKIGLPAMPALLQAVKDEDPDVREAALHGLSRMRPPPKAAVAAIIAVLKEDTDMEVRGSAAVALGLIGTAAGEAVPALIEALKDTKQGVRGTAVRCLGGIRNRGHVDVAALDKALDEARRAMERVAARADEMRKGKVGVPALIHALKDPNEYDTVRSAAAETLGRARSAARVAVPALVEMMLKGTDHLLRFRAANALKGMGPAASAAVPALIQVVRDLPLERRDRSDIRGCAAAALRNMGASTKELLPALIEELKDTRPKVRHSAANVLGNLGYYWGNLRGIGPAAKVAKAAVPALIQALKDTDHQVRVMAAAALSRIGPWAKAAVPALIEASKDEDPNMREAAAHALKAIRRAPRAVEKPPPRRRPGPTRTVRRPAPPQRSDTPEERARRLWSAARNYLANDVTDLARKKLEEIVKKYPDTKYAPLARKMLVELE